MKNNEAFIGFETWYNKFRMTLKMQKHMLIFCIILQFIFAYIMYIKTLTPSQRSIIFSYTLSTVMPPHTYAKVIIKNQVQNVTYGHIKSTYKPYVVSYIKDYKKYFRWSFLTYIFLIPLNLIFRRIAKKQMESKYIRGAKVITPKEFNKIYKDTETYLQIGQIKMPVEFEVMHTFIVGRPGVGKTVCISAIIEKIIKRGDRCIIHDFKGDYLAKFYNPEKDIIFNPLDKRSAYWNIFDEIYDLTDRDAVGYALIPDISGAAVKDPFWSNAARDVFTGCLNYMMLNGHNTYKELYSLLTMTSVEIGAILADTPGSEAGATHIADPQSKQTGSILSVMTQYTKIFDYMKDDDEFKIETVKVHKNKLLKDGMVISFDLLLEEIQPTLKSNEKSNWNINDPHDNAIKWLKRTVKKEGDYYIIDIKISKRFILKDWLDNPDAGNIFITNYSKLQNTLAPILSLMIDLFIRQLLSMPEADEDNNRRIFEILDEFGQLKNMQSTVSGITEGRSKGLCFIAGIQGTSQIDKIYGSDERKSIINSCGSSIIFNVSDPSISKELSIKLGEEIRLETTVTQSMGVNDNRDGISITQTEKKIEAVLPSEISSLPNLQCYLQFPGSPITKTRLKYKKIKNKHKPFVLRSGLSYEELIKNEKELLKMEKELVDRKGIFDYIPEEYETEDIFNSSFIDEIENNN